MAMVLSHAAPDYYEGRAMPRICDEEDLSLGDWIAAGDEWLARAGTLPLEQVQMLAVVAEPGRRAGVFQRELERRAAMEAT